MTDSNKSAAYETEADRARERIASTVDDIQDRLNPKRIVSEAASDLQDRGSALIESGARLVREHPVAVSLIGLSLGLLLLRRDSAPRSDAYEDIYGADDEDDIDGTGADKGPGRTAKAREAAARAKATVSEKATAARDAANDAWASAKDRSADYAARARDGLADAKQRASNGFDDNPLGGAVIGIAAGALIGALLPKTETEDKLLGETREDLAERAKAAVKAAVDAGKRELDERGLNVDTAKDKLEELAEQAKVVARNAGQAAAENLKARPAVGNA